MTRQSRMLLIVGLMAIAGVGALAMIANRYARLTPMRSVEDVVPRPGARVPAEVPDAPSGRPAPAPADSSAPAGGAEPAAEAARPDPAPVPAPAAEKTPAKPAVARPEEAAVEGFIAGRTLVKRFLAEHPYAARQFKIQITDQMHTQDRNPMFFKLMAQLRAERALAVQEAGRPEDEYRRVRDQFRIWHEGGEGLDPALGRVFEARREELEALHLGVMERIDDF